MLQVDLYEMKPAQADLYPCLNATQLKNTYCTSSVPFLGALKAQTGEESGSEDVGKP